MTRRLSVLYLTYNRADLLESVMDSLRPALAGPAFEAEIVVSDDASTGEHAARLGTLRADRLVTAATNRGLSHNHNQGLRACRFDLILSLQDDWKFVGQAADLEAAARVLETDRTVGLVVLRPPSDPLPHVVRTEPGGRVYQVFENDGRRRLRPSGLRPYSDQPHLKHRAFVDDLGPHREDLPMTRAELEFQRRVANQQRWRVAWIEGPSLFENLGADRSWNPGSPLGRRLDRAAALPTVGPAVRWARAGARKTLQAIGLRETA